MSSTDAPPSDPAATLRSRGFIGVLILAAIIGIVASLGAWAFLELVFYMKGWVYSDLPSALGFGTTPEWWSLPVLAVAGLAVGVAYMRLPGRGGHVPAEGLNAGIPRPVELPGILLAAIASIGLGAVLGPEAPLIAIGGGLGILFVNVLRKDAPPTLAQLLGVAGMFAGISFLFGSPIIAAALFIGAAAGLMAGQLPGFEMTPAVAVALGPAVVSVLRLPLSPVVLAVMLTSESGLGSDPLIILGVVAAYLTTLAISPPPVTRSSQPA